MTILNYVFALGLSALPLLSQGAGQKTGHVAAVPQGEIWKSETTEKEFRVRVEKDRLTAEWVNIPPDGAKQGAYIRSECRRVGEKWVGTSQVFLPCALPGDQKATHACHMTLRFEVDSISRDRITGGGESLRQFDCQSCKVLETAWAKFVWVPKQKAATGAKSSSGTRSNKKPGSSQSPPDARPGLPGSALRGSDSWDRDSGK